MTTPIEAQSFDQLNENFNNIVKADSGVDLALTPGSVIGAFRNAASFADLLMQSKGIEVGLNSRLDTCVGDDVDSFVLQFSPPFNGRLPAVAATSAPQPPTTLAAGATSTYLWLANVLNLLPTQALRITAGLKGASTTVTTIEPTTTLTVSAANGATTLTVASTIGMFVGQTLELNYNGFVTRVTVTSVGSGTQVNIAPLSAVSLVTFVGGATVVKRINTVAVAALTLDGGTLLTDLVTGSTVRPTSLLQGALFARRTATTGTVLIPNGTQIASPLTNIIYQVVADVTNPDYSVGAGGYYIPANGTQVYTKIQALNTGADQNVLPGMLTVLSTPISGVDTVTNPYGTTNGADVEDDDTLKARFKNFMTGRSSGTNAAVQAAIQGVATGIQFNVIENVANDGVTFQPGNFVVVAGDSNGLLNTALYTALFAAIDTARAITTTFVLLPPTVLQPIIVLVLVVKERSDLNAATIRTNVQTAIVNGFNATPAGSVLYFNKLIELAMDQDGVVDVTRCTVNGNGFDTGSGSYVLVGTGPAPYAASAFQFIRPPTANVQVS